MVSHVNTIKYINKSNKIWLKTNKNAILIITYLQFRRYILSNNIGEFLLGQALFLHRRQESDTVIGNRRKHEIQNIVNIRRSQTGNGYIQQGPFDRDAQRLHFLDEFQVF